MSGSLVAMLVGLTVAGALIGFVPGMYVGGFIQRGGQSREDARVKAAEDRYLARYGDMSTEQLRAVLDAAQARVVENLRTGRGVVFEADRREILRMQRELNRRQSAGEVEDR